MATKKQSSQLKLSPKLVQLCEWENIATVNTMLDAGESPASVCKYINSCGFKISNPLIYEYAKTRKQALLNNINMEKMFGVSASKTAHIKKSESYSTKKTKLKSELDALDKVIEKGYEDFVNIWSQKPVGVGVMMSAIKLKNELTNNSHNFLTQYGMEQLMELEKQKYDMLLELILQYIPEDIKDEVLLEMEVAEEEYYQSTEYYEEYLHAKGLPEDEILQKLQEQQAKQQAESNEDTVDLEI